jgi:hypothetical protein
LRRLDLTGLLEHLLQGVGLTSMLRRGWRRLHQPCGLCLHPCCLRGLRCSLDTSTFHRPLLLLLLLLLLLHAQHLLQQPQFLIRRQARAVELRHESSKHLILRQTTGCGPRLALLGAAGWDSSCCCCC